MAQAERIPIDYIEKLINVLRASSVHSFKMAGLEVVLGSPLQAQLPATDSTEKIKEVLTKQEESLPPELRADDVMNADKVLNWSSPDGFSEHIPLAGEQEL